MAEDKKSIIKEALTDYKEILEAANANAKKKLAEEFPTNFNNLLKEELNKNKAKESYKKIDDAEESEISDKNKSKKESDMKQVKETVTVTNTVGKGIPFKEKAKKVEEDVKVTATVGKSDPFNTKKIAKIDEEREKDFTADVESGTPNQQKGSTTKGNAFNKTIKNPTSGKPISNLKEEFDISELDMSSVGSAFENAGEDDDIITIDEIENEISQMQGLGEELDNTSSTNTNQGGTYNELVDMRKKLDDMINQMGSQTEAMNPQADELGGEYNSFDTLGEEFSLDETDEISDEDIEAVLGSAPEQEQEVDEQLGVSHASNRNMTASIPGNDYVGQGQLSRRREGLQENKKVTTLIEENKKLTKKLNETIKQQQALTALVEKYEVVTGKYRNQLKEMAVFNTNLAHANNLFVNESLALTHDDKTRIIDDFKKINTIAESQQKYQSLLSQLKGSKKTITESLEKKVTTSIQPSSKQKLDEVEVKTAYANDDHMKNMRRIINYVENRGKK